MADRNTLLAVRSWRCIAEAAVPRCQARCGRQVRTAALSTAFGIRSQHDPVCLTCIPSVPGLGGTITR